MTNKEMIDYAKTSMFAMMKEWDGAIKTDAAKALALLIMAENETKLPNGVVREVLD